MRPCGAPGKTFRSSVRSASEIGTRLYISHLTVGAHLAKIYAKLGATSRVRLHSAPSADQQP
jgi:DNA-binding CsgD family transcriptional regulator